MLDFGPTMLRASLPVRAIPTVTVTKSPTHNLFTNRFVEFGEADVTAQLVACKLRYC
jgi:hypothetical protein